MGKHSKSEKKKRGILSRIFRFFAGLILLCVLIFLGLLALLTFTEYKPADTEPVAADSQGTGTIKIGDSFTMLTWNIGYGALGEDTDFFMDGGTGVRTATKFKVKRNMEGMIEEIQSHDPDILFIQEADRNASRSHFIDEYEMLRDALPGRSSYFGCNYKVAYIPYPLPPLGKVDAGIATLTNYAASSSERVQLPISFEWPVSLANLKRCLLVTRIPIEGSDKELVLVNLHLEAYDSGEGKIAQTKMLERLLNAEYIKGNYVIAAGDFNQIFTSADGSRYPQQEGKWAPGVINISTLYGKWQFLMDEETPSCRSLDQPFIGADKDSFQYYLIDGYIVSENIEVESFKTEDLGFVLSDHNPVILKAKLK